MNRQIQELYSMPEMPQLEATARLMFCVVTQMFMSSYWHTGKIFVNTYGCFLELLQRTCDISVHKITLPEEKRKSLLAFHALTGCDTTSQFVGIGKQKAWRAFDGTSAVKLL